ncbi:MAG: acyl carrier protein [Magnetococcales bacterium]|nr:acyl carrier protein [Magnetococcales bacterium]
MEAKIKQIIADVMEVPVESVQDSSSPDTIPSWDSLKHMNLILALEQQLEITFSEEQIAEMMSVELIVLTVKELL